MDVKRKCYDVRNDINDYSIDRISNLPDCLVHQIFSSLETRFVVQTFLLSNRWKNLWINIPHLNFTLLTATPRGCYPPLSPQYHLDSGNYDDLPEFSPTSPNYSPFLLNSPASPTGPSFTPASPKYSPTSPKYCPFLLNSPVSRTGPSFTPASPTHPSTSAGSSVESAEYTPPCFPANSPFKDREIWRFNKFIYEVLNRPGGSKLDKFKLDTDYKLDTKFIHYIWSHIVSANVAEVEFNARGQSRYSVVELPKCVYASTSLEKLHLCVPSITLSQGFRALKELSLHYVDGYTSVICSEFFSECPALESLSFSHCALTRSSFIMDISAPKLKRLEILNSYFDQVSVSSPQLCYFKFEGTDVVNLFIDEKCCSLEEVDINLRVKHKYDDPMEKGNQLLQMLTQLASAKSVVVSLSTLMVLSKATNRIKSEPSPFPFMKKLKLKTNWVIPEDGWNFLLGNSDEVETSIVVPSLMTRLTPKSFRTF